MAKPMLVIDFGMESVSAGVFSGSSLERAFMRPVGEDLVQPLLGLASDLNSAGYKTFSRIVVGAPQSIVSSRVVTVPIKDAGKLREVLPFETGDLFLSNADEAIFSAAPLVGNDVVAVTANKAQIKAIGVCLSAVGLKPDLLSLSLFSRHLLLNELHKGAGAAAFIGKEFVVAARGGVPCLFRSITGLDDLRLALLALKEMETGNIYAAGPAMELLKQAGAQARLVHCDGERYSDEKGGLYALAQRFSNGSAPLDALVFKSQDLDRESDMPSAGKGIRTGALLLAVFVCVWLAYSYFRHSSFASGAREMDTAMAASYKAAFPNEAAPVDVESQLEIKVRDLKQAKDIVNNALWPVEAMPRLAEATGEAAIRLREMRLSSVSGGVSARHKGRLIASCEAASFEEADRFREKVFGLSYFKDVVVTDVKQSALGGVNFNLSASL
ncbi:MAG: hypothetical protein HY886_01790 [Deltaproteobacteria bacterium]|nr:hypothetical protein [Deltaproteobacteria bacterium]